MNDKAITLLQTLKEEGLSVKDLREAEKATNPKQYYSRKFEKIDYTPLVLDNPSWNQAIEHVDMPIQQVVGQYQLTEDGKPVGEHLKADYVTDSGREGVYYFMIVDRWKDGNWKVLSPTSDYYAALPVPAIYENLRDSLDATGSEYHITQCYNSYTGGTQSLSLEVTDLAGVGAQITSGMTMQIVLETSLDRSKRHTMNVFPKTPEGQVIFFKDRSSNYGLSVRHTESAREKAVDFNSAIGTMVKHWNEDIAPVLDFLADGELDTKTINTLIANIIDDAGVANSTADKIKFNAANRQGALEKLAAACATIEEVTDSPMAYQKQSDALGKAISKRVRRLMEGK